MTRTTPPRPYDVTAALPHLAPLARPATRLHPRPGSPTPRNSSVGGPLLWPATEPWPHCTGPHVWDEHNPAQSPDDVRLQRRIYETAADRAQGDPRLLQYTPEEEAADEYAGAGRPWPEGPIAMLPVAQLYRRDVPLLNPPGPADLLQVLWCPFDHPAHPRTAVFWRTAASITDALTAPPEPPAIQFPGYLPQPCVLAPEHVTEYPNDLELSQELRQQLEDCDVWRAAAADADETPGGFYSEELSVSPGWKLGGWTRWGLTDPQPRQCEVCGTELNPLLTIATREWVGATSTWIPHEDQAAPASPLDPYPAEPTKVQVADAYDLQLYVCPVSPDHPHLDLVQ